MLWLQDASASFLLLAYRDNNQTQLINSAANKHVGKPAQYELDSVIDILF